MDAMLEQLKADLAEYQEAAQKYERQMIEAQTLRILNEGAAGAIAKLIEQLHAMREEARE